MDAQLLISAARPDQFPAESLPEIAFLGRSNVGKSSLLNCLAGQNKLAFTSATPGRTQLINFYRVGEKFHFVDLPGYGFARVPKDVASRWKRLIEQYLLYRRSLELCFLILDARRGWMEQDLELKQWLEFHNRRFLVIATKTDKLKSQNQQRLHTDAIRSQTPDSCPLPFSAVTCRGVREIWQAISKIQNKQQ
ncbi:MAG TPA: ribosome biogenesis GTP-binding protein YihA/YsxC [Candidatus Solibacter sp.]|nr:ribosome biogenesis GTP-binding protein YihA/YsxC [Candidatus Solibacter sp.]